MQIELSKDVDIEAAAADFAAKGRTQIPHFLPKDAALQIHDILKTKMPWTYAYFDGERGQRIQMAEWSAMPPATRAEITQKHLGAAQQGFSFSYNSFHFRDEFRAGKFPDHPLRAFDAFLNSDEFLSFGRKLVGADDIRGTEGNASWYGPGHYLNIHDDHKDTHDRRAAFVFNFSPKWRADWCGELKVFSDRRGSTVVDSFFPEFNVLNVFRVPQFHSVAPVANFAGAPRLSVFGWFHADDPNQTLGEG